MNRLLFIFVIVTTKCAFGAVSPNKLTGENNLQKINKCCPIGQCVGRRRTCVETPDSQNFSSAIPVYTDSIYDSGMLLDDVFNLSENKFEDKQFRRESLDLSFGDSRIYLTESGVLQLEMPNFYDRWTSISPENYCVDCRLTVRKQIDPKPRFWAVVLETSTDDTTSTEMFGYVTFVSCFFLLLVLMVYMLLPELRNLSGVILMAYVISLFTAYLLLGVIQMSMYTEVGCITLTMGIYFSFLSSFFWMNIMAFDVWSTIRGYVNGHHIHRQGERFKFFIYCLYAFGVPLLMTIGLFLLNHYRYSMKHLPWFVTPHVPDYGCFLEGGVKLLYLYTPMLILILINCVFYLMTGFNVLRLRRKLVSINTIKPTGVSKAHQTHKQRFRDYLKLSLMMGLNWILEVLSSLYPGYMFWLISDFYNVLIGVVLFVIFICNKKVWDLLRDRFKTKKTTYAPNVAYSCATVHTTESESQAVDRQ